ncbi:MAG: TlpA disulfide reductase family protein [Myxococcota bacterium]
MAESPKVPSHRKPAPIVWLVGFALVAVASMLVLMAEPMAPHLSRGDMAPAFRLPSLNAETVVDTSDLQGRVTLLNFWATWCKPCEEEMPAMQQLQAELAGDDFVLLAISVDETRADVEAFQERLGLTFPILLDPEQNVARRYQTTGFPESFLVDQQGRIVERYVGPRDWDHVDYIDRIQRLVDANSEEKPAWPQTIWWVGGGGVVVAAIGLWIARKSRLSTR